MDGVITSTIFNAYTYGLAVEINYMKEMLMAVGGGGEREWVVPPPNIYGDVFLGEVPVNEFITGNDLAIEIGLTSGVRQHSDEPWLKFLTHGGKTLYVAKRSYRHSISWNQINALGAVYGTRTVVINGNTYKVRLLKGAASDPISGGSGHDPEQSWGSEWNRLFYPLVPNPTNTPTRPVSGEGLTFGSWANYTEANLVVSSGDGHLTWCQEVSAVFTAWRVIRGNSGLSFFNLSVPSDTRSIFGWRPVLELVE